MIPAQMIQHAFNVLCTFFDMSKSEGEEVAVLEGERITIIICEDPVATEIKEKYQVPVEPIENEQEN